MKRPELMCSSIATFLVLCARRFVDVQVTIALSLQVHYRTYKQYVFTLFLPLTLPLI